MGCLCGKNGVTRHLDSTIRAVLETDRATQAAGELAVALALGGACPNGAPTYQITDELGAEQVQKFGAHGQPQSYYLQQQRARKGQPFIDRKAAIHVRIVDVALPAHGSARLLKIGAHHDEQFPLKRIRLPLEPVRIFHGLRVVVDGARAHHHDQSVVAPMQHVANRSPAALHHCQHGFSRGQLLLQQRRGGQRPNSANAGVIRPNVVGA